MTDLARRSGWFFWAAAFEKVTVETFAYRHD